MQTQSFPPVDAAVAYLKQVDYRKLYHQFIDAVVIVCAFVAAVYTVAKEKWVEYDCTLRVKLGAIAVKETAIKIYNWTIEIAIPFLIELYNEIRSFYNVMRVAVV